MAATAMLAKLAIPLGVGLLFIASRGKASNAKGVTLTRRAVRAMQSASAEDLEDVISDFRSEDDATTAGALEFQKARMVSRGTPGFTSLPTDDRDGVLKVNAAEFAARLIQLEGRAKALDAWAEAYDSVSAKKTAADLRNKAKELRKASPKADTESDKDSGSGVPDSVIRRVTDAVATGDPAKMRAEAAKLRKEGFKAQADALDKAADEVEAELKRREEQRPGPAPSPTPSPSPSPSPAPSPSPGPSPSPAPKPRRTVTVTSTLNSEARITKKLIGSDTRWPELVKANIPKDADGRSRVKLTSANANGESLNRLGGLKPGLQPGQKLFIPDDWVLLDEPAPRPSPAPAPTPGDPRLTQTRAMILHVAGKTQGKEDTTLVSNWQRAMQRPVDGKYGPGDGIFIADTFNIVPPTPLWWPKNNTSKALTNWKQEMARKAIELPSLAAGFTFAGDNGKQPGFNAPTGTKVVSKLLGVAE